MKSQILFTCIIIHVDNRYLIISILKIAVWISNVLEESSYKLLLEEFEGMVDHHLHTLSIG